jgi:hypothetical protein
MMTYSLGLLEIILSSTLLLIEIRSVYGGMVTLWVCRVVARDSRT